MLNQFQQLARLQQQELLHFAEFLVQKQHPPKPAYCRHTIEKGNVDNTVITKPVSLGAKCPNLDNVAEIIAAAEGEMYK